MTIDIDALRDYMEKYYGTAIFSGMPMAMIDDVKIKKASDMELVNIAIKEGVDISKFEVF